MFLQTREGSARQRVAIEAKAGRGIHDQEDVVLWRGKAKVASAQERENAAQRVRYQLYLLDPSERRMSIEECAAALLKKTEMA